MTEWKPIETAPKDGRQIIVFIPWVVAPSKKSKQRTHVYHPLIRSAFWSECVENKNHEPKDRAKFLQNLYGGYWSCDAKGRNPLHGMPTHWMPLPEPPK